MQIGICGEEEGAIQQKPASLELAGLVCRSLRCHLSVSSLYCASVRGTTLNRPCRTRGESANSLFAFISASVTGLASGLPTLIFTCGFLGSTASTDTTVAVPTALFSSPV